MARPWWRAFLKKHILYKNNSLIISIMAGGKKMLQIEKELFQWEKGRQVIVKNPEVTTVEFYNKKSEYGDEVFVKDG
jgi:hypothetical protein